MTPTLTVVSGEVTYLSLDAPDVVSLSLDAPMATQLTLAPVEPIQLSLAAPEQISLELSPVGVPGPQGPPGKTDDYVHHQVVPSASWTVNHGRDYPREPVVLLDSNPHSPVWTDWVVDSVGTMVLIFPTPVTGYAYI